MIFTYYQYTDTSGSTPKQKYNIHQNSIICTGSDGSPRPNQKVYVVNTINDQKVMKLAFSNFLVENGAVSRYNSCHYKHFDSSSNLSNIEDARWVPGVSYNTIENSYPSYSWHRETYITTLKVAVKHDNNEQYLNFLNSENDSLGKPYFSQFAVVDGHKSTIAEWPSPIVIRTGDGSIIKFYDTEDTLFQYPIYWKNCGIKVTFVYNLIPNKTYNYIVYDQEGQAIRNIYGMNSNYGTITTEGEVRMIKLNGTRNVRDVGGWSTQDGTKKFKYGIIYRGAQLDEIVDEYGRRPYFSPEAAINNLDDRREFFKLDIQSEIDARGENTSKTISDMIRIDEQGIPESQGIDYYCLSGTSYQGMASVNGYKNFVTFTNKILESLESNKNIYMHCQEGTDRTGTYFLILKALCGINSDALIKDYELSSLWTSSTYNRARLQKGTLGSSSTISTTACTLGSFGVKASTSIQSAIQSWFTNKYSNLKIKKNKTDIATAAEAIEYIKSKLLDNPSLQKKRITVIGDSQSEFKTGRHGDTIANMWWYKAAKSLNIDSVENLNNNSFGESRVTYSNSKSKRGCSLERLQQLKVNGKNPDFIFNFMGGNDWGSSAAIGSWNIGDSFPTEYDSKGDEIRLDFKPAYALMLNRLNELYPNALKVCITEPLLSMKKTGGRPIKDWMEAIVDIAKKFNLPVIDLYKLCGQTIWKEVPGNNTTTGNDAAEPSASSKYISDMWVHLNPLGQQYIADKINAELQKILYPHMAIIGDSISAYKEFNTNRRYGSEYPKTTSNGSPVSNPVSSPTQMWWYKVSQYLGYDGRVVNASCSGSTLCKSTSALANQEIPDARAVDDIRVNDLYVNPDKLETIIVAIGINDGRIEVPIGSWDVGDPYPDESASTIDFKPGYALLLHKLKTRYPKAKIYCCNLYRWYGSPSYIENCKAAVEDIAAKFGCTVIDTYTQCTSIFKKNSSATATYMLPDATHPNAKGQQVIADVVIEKLQELGINN